MLDEINSKRLYETRINPVGWYLGKLRQVWQLHRSLAPASKLRNRYILGLGIGSIGFVIAIIGMFSSAGTATGNR
jgi:hypothetical protein